MFDPLGEYLKPRFQGFRLFHGKYEAILPERDRSIISQELGAILRPDDKLLRVVDRETGLIVPEMTEAAEIAEEMQQLAAAESQRADSESQRADAEAQRASLIQSENERLRAEIEELRRKLGQP